MHRHTHTHKRTCEPKPKQYLANKTPQFLNLFADMDVRVCSLLNAYICVYICVHLWQCILDALQRYRRTCLLIVKCCMSMCNGLYPSRLSHAKVSTPFTPFWWFVSCFLMSWLRKHLIQFVYREARTTHAQTHSLVLSPSLSLSLSLSFSLSHQL